MGDHLARIDKKDLCARLALTHAQMEVVEVDCVPERIPLLAAKVGAQQRVLVPGGNAVPAEIEHHQIRRRQVAAMGRMDNGSIAHHLNAADTHWQTEMRSTNCPPPRRAIRNECGGRAPAFAACGGA